MSYDPKQPAYGQAIQTLTFNGQQQIASQGLYTQLEDHWDRSPVISECTGLDCEPLNKSGKRV